MGETIYFTDNYTDRSTREGYQFEFFCRRCGNGYASSFQHSVSGFGGKLLQVGGDLIGGTVGSTAREVGWDTWWLRDGVRGTARDKALAKAVDEITPQFCQCHRCGHWVCQQVCWNAERGMCVSCAPKLDQEVAGLQAAAQIRQLNTKISEQDWTGRVLYQEEATAICPACHAESGGGKFCQHCGTALGAAAVAAAKTCTHCGAAVGTARFCGECGTPADG